MAGTPLRNQQNFATPARKPISGIHEAAVSHPYTIQDPDYTNESPGYWASFQCVMNQCGPCCTAIGSGEDSDWYYM